LYNPVQKYIRKKTALLSIIVRFRVAKEPQQGISPLKRFNSFARIRAITKPEKTATSSGGK